jgi:hypothetical protein
MRLLPVMVTRLPPWKGPRVGITDAIIPAAFGRALMLSFTLLIASPWLLRCHATISSTSAAGPSARRRVATAHSIIVHNAAMARLDLVSDIMDTIILVFGGAYLQ